MRNLSERSDHARLLLLKISRLTFLAVTTATVGVSEYFGLPLLKV